MVPLGADVEDEVPPVSERRFSEMRKQNDLGRVEGVPSSEDDLKVHLVELYFSILK